MEDLGGCLAYHGGVCRCRSAFQVVLYYGLGVVIGPEHLSEVLDLLPSLSFVAYLLCSDPQALYDTSEHFDRVMQVDVEVPVCVCLLAEDRDPGSCSSPSQHPTPQLDKDKLVKNFSSRSLTEKEKELLALGLNFAVTPRQIPTLQIIAATESTASQLDKETAQQLRHRVSSILSTAKPPRSNLSREIKESVRSLHNDENIVILPANKGGTTARPNGLRGKDGEPTQ